MPLSDIVNVQITRQTQTVSEANFGTLMILGSNKNWNNFIKKYSSMQEIAADFNPWDKEYISAQDVFSQTITVPFIYIGRRTVDVVDVFVETTIANKQYTVTINGIDVTINSDTGVQQSTVTLNAALVSGNLINVSLNGTIVGTVTSKITYSTAFTSGTSTVTTVNGVALTAVPFTSSNSGTLNAIAAQLLALPAVATVSSNGTDTVTVVFLAAGNNTVDSSATTGGSAPTSTISEGGFSFSVSNAQTMQNIATAIALQPDVETATVSGDNDEIITVIADPERSAVIDFFTVTLGMSQATATIDDITQPTDPDTIAQALVDAINAEPDLGVTAATPVSPDGSFSITADVSGVPYTVSVSTSITDPNQCRVLITQAIPNQYYIVRINGTKFQYTAPNDVVDNEEIAAALVELINADPALVPVTASDNLDGSFELVTSDGLQNTFNIQVSPAEVMVVQKGLIIGPYIPTLSVSTDLDNIQAVNDDWYALALLDRTSATVQAAATWIEPQIKIFGTASDDLDIINKPPGTGMGDDDTSIAYILNNLGYVRSFVIYHADANSDYPECAWFGNCLPLTPGAETWAFKTLRGISYSDLSSDQESNAFAKSCNTYEYIGGVGITQRGTMAGNEYIDIIRGVDWLTSTIQSYVYSVLVNNPKVPYTDAGITAIESQIRRALLLGITNNFIAQDPPIEIIVPKASNVPAIDKVDRILRGVSFTATLAGAIQAVEITGTVSV